MGNDKTTIKEELDHIRNSINQKNETQSDVDNFILLDKIIYAIILGGALGNFYDRLVYKAVPDFIDLHFNNFHWFTFNVADILISLGIIIIIIKGFFVNN